ncbi:hypothetical protein TNCV_3564061 [Trichonephila clavipes]|nr:hypothetical protein TNCV_3564061 [Trichonephila clavipes]
MSWEELTASIKEKTDTYAVSSPVVRASDSRPEGVGSMPDATKYPPSTHGVNKRKRSLDQLTFRIALARQLINGYSSRKRRGRSASFQAKKCVVPNDGRIATTRGLLAKDLETLNYGQVTRLTPELVPPLLTTTPTGGRFSVRQI